MKFSKLHTMINHNNKTGEFIRFILVGIIAVAIQLFTYIFFVSVLSLSPIIGTILSYGISFTANFFMSSAFTFNSRANVKKGLAFSVCHVINLGTQIALVAFFKEIDWIGNTFAIIPAMIICVPTNFIMVRWAFKAKCLQTKN